MTWAHEVKLTDSISKIPKALKQQREKIRWLSRTEQHALLRRVERYGSARDLGAVKTPFEHGAESERTGSTSLVRHHHV